MTHVREQIYVLQGTGSNQRDDEALVFTLYMKSLLTSERCGCIYQFEKLTKVAWNERSSLRKDFVDEETS